MPNPEEVITVRVEVQVPFGAARPTVTAAAAPGLKLLASPSGVEEPVPWQHTRVRHDTTSGKNYICAYGTAVQGGVAAVAVFAKVYQEVILTSGLGSTPDSGAWGVYPDQSTGAWSFEGDNDLPGAACDQSSGGVANTLALWTLYGGSFAQPEAIPFSGVYSTVTQCGSPALAAPPVEFHRWHEHVPDRLVGTLSGGPAGWPREAEFVRESSREEWHCRARELGARYVLFREGGRFFLRQEGARPVLFAPRREGGGKPVYLVFEVAGPGAAEPFVLTVTE